MNVFEVDFLQEQLKHCAIAWVPDNSTILMIDHIGEHAEEGAGYPCAIAENGKYVALDNAALSDFCLLKRINHMTVDIGKRLEELL